MDGTGSIPLWVRSDHRRTVRSVHRSANLSFDPHQTHSLGYCPSISCQTLASLTTCGRAVQHDKAVEPPQNRLAADVARALTTQYVAQA